MRRFFLFYFLFCFFFFSLFASGVVDSQDGFQYLAVARNIYYEHRPTVPAYNFPEKNIHMNITKGKDGRWYSITGLGYSIALLPAVALSDALHRLYSIDIPVYFPLQSDFSILLFASYTNFFFAALLCVILYAYLIEMKSSHSHAILWSFLSIVGTNLFAYAKHSFAHMMYITFLVWAFYFLKRFSSTKRRWYLFWAGVMYGVVVISYSPVFVLPLIPLILYYTLSLRFSFHRSFFSTVLQDLGHGLVGLFPFIVLYFWYNTIRIGNPLDSGYGVPRIHDLYGSPKVLFEGLWGFLFSPGRSFFLYSPLALLPVIFWHKIAWKKYAPELISFLALSAIFLYFYASQQSGPNWYSWNGESSFGPRYITPLLPFWILISGRLYAVLSRKEKLFTFVPLLVCTLWMQCIGILLPYQIKFGALQPNLFINGLEYTQSDYGNFIPRLSPLLVLSRQLTRRLFDLPKTFDHGMFSTRFLEGFDFPFFLGNSIAWRGFSDSATLSIENPKRIPIQTLSFEMSNTKLDKYASHAAQVKISLDGKILGTTQIDPEQWGRIDVSIPSHKDSLFLELQRIFVGTSSAKQVVFLKNLRINSQEINLASRDLTLYEELAAKMSEKTYKKTSPAKEDPWALWKQNSAIYETSFDLWWIRALYYQDYPRQLFILPVIQLLAMSFFGKKVLSYRP